jgi:hypothetical protein
MVAAAAVNQAVRDFTGSDGSGKCAWYAAAGYILASHVLGRAYLPQVGTLRLLVQPPDGWLVMDARLGGVETGEFHAWFIGGDLNVKPGRHVLGKGMEVLDLAARHYQRFVGTGQASAEPTAQQSETAERPLIWTQEGPPTYIWGRRPGCVGFDADERAMRLYWERFLKPRRAEVRDLVMLALAHYRRAITGSPCRGGPACPAGRRRRGLHPQPAGRRPD